VVGITIAPVKGLALSPRQEVRLGPIGVREDRAFFLVDARRRMVNGKTLGRLVQVAADFSADRGTLTLAFPDGHSVAGALALAEPRPVQFYRGKFDAQTVIGPWAAALSEFCGREVVVCRAPLTRQGVDRGVRGAISLVSRASLDALRRAGAVAAPIDPRRFRMLLEIDGVGAHAEDTWRGRTLGIGEATVRINDLVGRCAVTTHDPDTGTVDLPTLHILRRYRGNIDSVEKLPFGVFGEVIRPGRVRVGDSVTPEPISRFAST
jgi:uncharacterized protein YcbX